MGGGDFSLPPCHYFIKVAPRGSLRFFFCQGVPEIVRIDVLICLKLPTKEIPYDPKIICSTCPTRLV